MKKETILLIDFDITFVTVESLDVLADIVLQKRKDKEAILANIQQITRLGMEGKITFPESLAKRLQLFQPHKKHIEQLTAILSKKISRSVERNKEFFQKNSGEIYILSGGFKEYMVPILKPFGILENHVLGNTFIFDGKGNVVGCDAENLLAQDKGKVKKVKEMNFKDDLYMLGDGYTDYEIKQAGVAKKFIVFTENIKREAVIKNADIIANNFEEVMDIL